MGREFLDRRPTTCLGHELIINFRPSTVCIHDVPSFRQMRGFV